MLKADLAMADLKVDSESRNLLGEAEQKHCCIEQIGLKLGFQIYRSTAD
jgi:hypothetical protein